VKFTHEHYVPCLRWKQGEYQAVLRLSSAGKQSLTPCIEVPEIGFDFETRTDNKTIDEHLAPFSKRVRKKWGKAPCFVDLKLLEASSRMTGGEHPVDFTFNGLRAEECHAVPVTGLHRDSMFQRAISKVAKKDENGLCVRVDINEAYKAGFKAQLSTFLKEFKTRPDNCDLILDLGSPNFLPLEGFAKLVRNVIAGLPHLNKWRTFTLLASSFPKSMAEIKSSPEILKRYEWLLYKEVVNSLSSDEVRIPTFGDYAINHPSVLRVDMRIVTPSASIRYSVDDAWFIVKGANARKNREQYRGLCGTVMASHGYCGAGFSDGDRYIEGCAAGSESTGNLTTWRWVGTNHHLEKVVQDVANFYASASIP
jgi:hypothetical protein